MLVEVFTSHEAIFSCIQILGSGKIKAKVLALLLGYPSPLLLSRFSAQKWWFQCRGRLAALLAGLWAAERVGTDSPDSSWQSTAAAWCIQYCSIHTYVLRTHKPSNTVMMTRFAWSIWTMMLESMEYLNPSGSHLVLNRQRIDLSLKRIFQTGWKVYLWNILEEPKQATMRLRLHFN